MNYKPGDSVRCVNTDFTCNGKVGVIQYKSGIFWHVDYPGEMRSFPNTEDELEFYWVVGEQLLFNFEEIKE